MTDREAELAIQFAEAESVRRALHRRLAAVANIADELAVQGYHEFARELRDAIEGRCTVCTPTATCEPCRAYQDAERLAKP